MKPTDLEQGGGAPNDVADIIYLPSDSLTIRELIARDHASKTATDLLTINTGLADALDRHDVDGLQVKYEEYDNGVVRLILIHNGAVFQFNGALLADLRKIFPNMSNPYPNGSYFGATVPGDEFYQVFADHDQAVLRARFSEETESVEELPAEKVEKVRKNVSNISLASLPTANLLTIHQEEGGVSGALDDRLHNLLSSSGMEDVNLTFTHCEDGDVHLIMGFKDDKAKDVGFQRMKEIFELEDDAKPNVVPGSGVYFSVSIESFLKALKEFDGVVVEESPEQTVDGMRLVVENALGGTALAKKYYADRLVEMIERCNGFPLGYSVGNNVKIDDVGGPIIDFSFGHPDLSPKEMQRWCTALLGKHATIGHNTKAACVFRIKVAHFSDRIMEME